MAVYVNVYFLKEMIIIDILIFLWNWRHVNATEPHWWKAKISSGDVLVPLDNRSFAVSMLTQIYGVTRVTVS